MRYPPFVLAALVATASPPLAAAQRVTAEVRIGSGPRDYGGPAYDEVVVYRAHRGHGWWRHRGYRAVTAWYDDDRDRYYDHLDRDGLREVVIYERDGRYYGDRYDRADDGRYDRWTSDHRYRHDENDDDHDRD
jgi:hypothetical protein